MDGIVKNLSFGKQAKNKVFKGIEQLTKAVSSTLGASGKCVIMEDSSGNPIITKDTLKVSGIILRENANHIDTVNTIVALNATLLFMRSFINL